MGLGLWGGGPSEPLQHGIISTPSLQRELTPSEAAFLGHQVFTKIGEAFEFFLVDLLHYCVIHKCKYWLFPGKVLVKIIDISFGFLWREKKRC